MKKAIQLLTGLAFVLSALSMPALADYDDEDDDYEALDEYEDYDDVEDLQEDLKEFLTEEDDGKFLANFIQKEFPDLVWSEMTFAIKRHPFDAYQAMQDLGEIASEYYEMREYEPERAELYLDYQRHDVTSLVLARKLERSEDGSERRQLEEKIRSEVAKAFELKLDSQKAEIAALENEVEELRALIQKREAAREKVIERRVRELVGEDDYLDW